MHAAAESDLCLSMSLSSFRELEPQTCLPYVAARDVYMLLAHHCWGCCVHPAAFQALPLKLCASCKEQAGLISVLSNMVSIKTPAGSVRHNNAYSKHCLCGLFTPNCAKAT